MNILKGRKPFRFLPAIEKRQKFVIAVILLSLLLFFTGKQYIFSGISFALIFGLLTDVFLFWAVRSEARENKIFAVFILPFFYTLSFSLFYFLIPQRLLFRAFLTIIYGVGLYSLFLSENVFVVAAIRTIALLSGARIVSFVITLLSYFFISNIIFTFHLPLVITLGLIALYTYPLMYQSIWSYTVQKTNERLSLWVLLLTVCILESAGAVWFWPSSPTVFALFLTGFFYTVAGLSHMWFERRLFRGVLWEYVWVGAAVFFVLVSFTAWGK